MIKVIIFDFDGVIVESLDVKMRAFAELFKNKGEETVRRVVDYHLLNGGVSRYDKFRYIYSDILKQPLPQHEYERLCNDFAALVFDGVIASPYVSGVLEFLKKNFKKYRMYIASATPRDELVRILDHRDIIGYFDRLFGAPTRKSDAVGIILEETGALPSEVVFIGDALSDYEAARSGGIYFVARIHNNDELFSELACDGRIQDLGEFDSILQELQTYGLVVNANER